MIEGRLARIDREVSIPAAAIIVMGFLLAGLGAAGIWAENEASHYRLPYAAGDTLLLTYVTGALILMALGFLGYRPSSRPAEQWATVIAAAHGFFGVGLGFSVAYGAVVGCQCLT